jgi:hypothetical protein
MKIGHGRCKMGRPRNAGSEFDVRIAFKVIEIASRYPRMGDGEGRCMVAA